MVLDFNAYQKLKAYLKERGLTPIHLNDCCGSQYFSMEQPDPATADALRAYFAPMGVLADFTDDLSSFMLLDQDGTKA